MQKLLKSKNITNLLTATKVIYNYTPVSNYRLELKENPIIGVNFGIDRPQITIRFRLFENVVPKTVENFKRMLLGTAQYNGRSLSLVGSKVKRIIPRSYVELGHLEAGNCSIYGPYFPDESFELYHDRSGLLTSMSEQNTNNSRFGLTFAPASYFDFRNVVFGEVTADSFDSLRQIERLGSKFGKYQIISTEELVKGGEMSNNQY